MKYRNSYIELLRFVFSSIVVITHYGSYYPDNRLFLKWQGWFSVEFFFILSGFLLASYCSRIENRGEVWKETWQYMGRKVKALSPVYYTALIVSAAHYILKNNLLDNIRKLDHFFIQLVPSLLIIPSNALSESTNIPYSWYIGTMMIGMLILFPLVYRLQKNFSLIVAPLVLYFYCAYALHTHGSLWLLTQEWLGICWPQLLRGIAEMSLGCTAFEISRMLSKRYGGRLTNAGRVAFTFLSVVLFAIPIFWMLVGIPGTIQLGALLMLAFGTAVSFSGLDRMNAIANAPTLIFLFLGKLSLPLYLGQGLVQYWFPVSLTVRIRGSIIYYMACILMAVTLYYAAQLNAGIIKMLCRKVHSVCVVRNHE